MMKNMTESKLFRSKIYKAFKNTPRFLIETGSGTCIMTGERDYGFMTRDGIVKYAVTRRKDGKFEVQLLKSDECQCCKGTGVVEIRAKKVIA